MKQTVPDPERWSERPLRSGAAEDLVGASFRSVQRATEPSEESVFRLSRSRSVPQQPTVVGRAGRLAVALSLILATGSAVGAVVRGVIYFKPSAAPDSKVGIDSSILPSVNASVRGAYRVLAATTPDASTAVSAGIEHQAASSMVQPVPSAVTTPLPFRERAELIQDTPARLARGSLASVPSNSEARLLRAAFRSLRSEGDAAAALRTLDSYARRFPEGALRQEARVARVEAFVRLDRSEDALALLEDMQGVGGGVLTRSMRITRGELLAKNGRCADALRDFNVVVASTYRDSADARALYGRASCYLRVGSIQEARPDLARYLALYPDNAFASHARRALEELP